MMLAVIALLAVAPVDAIAERFLSRYFEQYPTRATEAGLVPGPVDVQFVG